MICILLKISLLRFSSSSKEMVLRLSDSGCIQLLRALLAANMGLLTFHPVPHLLQNNSSCLNTAFLSSKCVVFWQATQVKSSLLLFEEWSGSKRSAIKLVRAVFLPGKSIMSPMILSHQQYLKAAEQNVSIML
jgi:hypothetical protein